MEQFIEQSIEKERKQDIEVKIPAPSKRRTCCRRHGEVIRRAPSVLVVPFVVLAVLVGAGLAIVYTSASSETALAEQQAITQATETGRWFSLELARALLPVFGLAQFATEIEEFESLPEAVGPAHFPGSLPFASEPTTDGVRTHRNVTGSQCEDEAVMKRWMRIASTIKKNADMAPGILVGLNLVPRGVICLVYPLNNTEDFEDGVYFDRTPIIGLDLLEAPDRKAGSEATLPDKRLVVIGPLELKECDGTSECNPIVEEALIARISILSDNHTITLSNGEEYGRWGFAEAIINWAALRAQVYEDFQTKNLEFSLTGKRDTSCSSVRSDCADHVHKFAQTEDFESVTSGARGWPTVSVVLDASVDEWQMTVAYPDPAAEWKGVAIALVVLVSCLIAALVYYIMYQRQLQFDLAAEKHIIEKKILTLERKKQEMTDMLREARATIAQRKEDQSTVGVLSTMRKIGRLEEEMGDVNRDIVGLSQEMKELSSEEAKLLRAGSVATQTRKDDALLEI